MSRESRSSADKGANQVIPIRAGGATFALNVTSVGALHRLEELEANPNGTDPMGWVKFAKHRIPVSDLNVMLGGRWTPSEGRRIAIIHAKGQATAFLIDSVGTPMILEAKERFPLPIALRRQGHELFSGVAVHDDEPMLLLSAEAILRAAASPAGNPARSTPTARPSFAPPLHSMQSPALGTQPGVYATTRQLVTFGVPSVLNRPFRLGLSSRQVPELVAPPEIVSVPGTPPYVRGLTSWRQQPVVVVDLGVGMGLASEPGDDIPRLLIARMSRQQALLGIPVNRDVETLQLGGDVGACKLPEDMNQATARGFFQVGGYPVMIPNIDQVVDSFR